MSRLDLMRAAWSCHGSRVLALLAALPLVWLASPDLQAMLPPRVVAMLQPPLAILGWLLRARQSSLTALDKQGK